LSPAFSGEGYPRSDLRLVIEARPAINWSARAVPPNTA
jgi:hypothetical protein